MNLAGQYHVEPEHTRHVAHLALSLFDELANAGLHDAGPVERELLWASCVLHDIGVAIDYDDHHKHSRYLVHNAGLPGFSQREVALIGQVVRYHRKGNPDMGPFGDLAEKGDADRLARCATLLRLAEDLERSRDQAVTATKVSVRNGTARVQLVATGDLSVPRWAAARETALFERAFGKALEIA